MGCSLCVNRLKAQFVCQGVRCTTSADAAIVVHELHLGRSRCASPQHVTLGFAWMPSC